MHKCLSKKERNFNVCSDCIYFHETNIIDERFPQIVEGYCDIHEGIKDNRWETKCEDCTGDYCCFDCIHYKYLYDKDCNKKIHFCKIMHDEIEPEINICTVFEKKD